MCVLLDQMQKAQEHCNPWPQSASRSLQAWDHNARLVTAVTCSAILNQKKAPHRQATPRIQPTEEGKEEELLMQLYE